MDPDSGSIIVVALVVFLAFAVHVRSKRKRLSLPPGPPGLPLVGNTYNFPREREWLAYSQWAKEFGSDIIHLNLCGTSVIVVNTAKAAVDLFERRSAIYSDRPRNTMLNEVIGWDYHFAFMRYGERWRAHRRAFHLHYNASAMREFQPNMTRNARQLLHNFLCTPEDFLAHISHMAGAVIMDITYGLQVLPKDDPYITAAQTAMYSVAVAGNAGAFLVDVIPILKYVPSWFPGAAFKRKAAEWNKSITIAVDLPADSVKAAIIENRARPTVMANMLNTLIDTDTWDHANETLCREVAGAAYVSGSDTTLSAIQTFILAMILYPQVQEQAQKELDDVIGQGRLPEFSDRSSLPYTTAVMKEVLRWNPVTPLGVPHMVTTEDEYNGYRIPAGSVVVSNIWAILHDEERFPDHMEFKPERFLNADGTLNPKMNDVELAAFGFGRRICPGKHLATASIWITIASVLSAFTLKKAVDEHGHVIHPRVEYTTGLISHSEPFACNLMPRSAAAESLIQSGVD